MPLGVEIPFPIEKRPQGSPLDKERVLRFGYLADKILTFGGVEKKGLFLAISNGNFALAKKLQERVLLQEHDKEEIKRVLFEYCSMIQGKITIGNVQEVFDFFEFARSFGYIEGLSEKIYEELNNTAGSSIFLLKPDVFVWFYKKLGTIPESIVSHNATFKLKAKLEKTVIETAKASLTYEKGIAYQVLMAYSPIFEFLKRTEKLPVCSGIHMSLTKLFEEYYLYHIELLASLCNQMGNMEDMKTFFDGVVTAFPEYKIAQYFFEILSILYFGNHKDNIRVRQAIAEVLIKYSFNIQKVHELLRSRLKRSDDFDRLYTVFDAEKWVNNDFSTGKA